jgi:hypothetical protein
MLPPSALSTAQYLCVGAATCTCEPVSGLQEGILHMKNRVEPCGISSQDGNLLTQHRNQSVAASAADMDLEACYIGANYETKPIH